MTAVLLRTEFHWTCPNCTFTDITYGVKPHTRFHICKQNGLNAPMVQDGVRAKVEVRRPEDYIRNEMVQTDPNGRPIMSVITTRDEGQDCAIYAPTAQATREDM